ncbi:MAG: methanogenesis marker 3 protein [Candidatus Methanoplasma sp.]|jgi:putative methanogenesis marker protein 3|nr:methanogenesis marker 3 protein [Candidatus Methanoplasma sp.]
MKVTVNGKEKELENGAALKDAVKGETYVPGSLISIHLSTERLVRETEDYELVTSKGTMTLHLDDTDGARLWKSVLPMIKGSTVRWSTRDITAFGSFRTDIPTDRTVKQYRKYDCFFTLGGSDNHSTYIMIAKKDHARSYGAGIGGIGRITLGRHVLGAVTEGDGLLEIRPLVSEESSENIVVTKDLGYELEEGYSVDTNVLIKLDAGSPASAEQILTVGSEGRIRITDSAGTMIGCSDDLDVKIPDEVHLTRERGSVVVRNTGHGTGCVLIYRERRQASPVHNSAGTVERGYGIVSRAAAGDTITIETEPARIMSVGMTQSEGERFLSGLGLKQKRSGLTSDDAVIVDQIPDMTLLAVSSGTVETVGVPKEKVFKIQLDGSHPADVHYFRKITGLWHKSVGSLKTQFSFPGMPMITFYGDEERSKSIYPQDPFKKCKKGDIGITNQSRPHHGLIGIRLEDSKEYGPTGEEPYGTNLVGRFVDDLGKLSETDEEETIYVMEDRR